MYVDLYGGLVPSGSPSGAAVVFSFVPVVVVLLASVFYSQYSAAAVIALM